MSQNNSVYTDVTRSVARSFGRSAPYYDRKANLQKEVARRLIASLEPWIHILPPGPVLEIGCGTGFVTEGLLELLPDRELQVTDISDEMVKYCRDKFRNRNNISFDTLNVENSDLPPESYAMTIGGFVAQWFDHPAETLGKWLRATRPGGLLLTSFPGSDSFPEWKEACRELGLPFTGNRLPDTEEMVIKLSGDRVQVDYYEDTVVRRFKSSAGFFRHMKTIGAGKQKEGRHLSVKEMRRLIHHWDQKTRGDIQVSYHLVFIAAKRNHDS